MNVMSPANLRGVVRDPQQRTGVRVLQRIAWTGALLLVSRATLADAQIGRGRRGQEGTAAPDYWVGLSYGLYELGTYTDGPTNTQWGFGYTTQLAASFEKTLSAGAALGIEAGFASPRLDYTPAGSFCATTNCVAKASVTQYLATARVGAGVYGIRSSLIIKAGATQFSDFRDETTGDRLPGGGKWDPTFGTGYDFGLALSPKTDVYFETALLFVFHDQGTTVSATPPINYTLKLGLRQGF